MYFNGSSAVSFVNLSFMLMKHSRAEEWEGAEISSARGCYTVGQKSKTAWTVIDGAALPGNLILSCIGAKYTGEDSIKLTWQEECGGHGACHHHPQNIECDLALVSFPDPPRKNRERVWQHVYTSSCPRGLYTRANQIAEIMYVTFNRGCANSSVYSDHHGVQLTRPSKFPEGE